VASIATIEQGRTNAEFGECRAATSASCTWYEPTCPYRLSSRIASGIQVSGIRVFCIPPPPTSLVLKFPSIMPMRGVDSHLTLAISHLMADLDHGAFARMSHEDCLGVLPSHSPLGLARGTPAIQCYPADRWRSIGWAVR